MNANKFGFLSIVLSLIVTSFADTQIVYAQDDNSALRIEEVIVSARKREEPLQETPVAATVLSEMKLQLSFANDVKNLPIPAPNVTISQKDFFSNAVHFAIRGLASDDIESTFDPPVALFVDGVYLPRPVNTNLDLFDVEQIEILRGPQGTLFGRNTTGGAIQVKSRRPTDEFEGRGEAVIGEYGRVNLSGVVNIPIIENTLNARIAAQSKNSDGYFSSNINSNDLGGEDIFSIRPIIHYKPTDTLDLTIIGEYHKNKSDVWPGQNESDSTKILCDLHGYCGFPLGGGKEYSVDLGDAGDLDVEVWGITVEANWDVNSGTITSVSNYRATDDFMYINGDMTEATMFELTRKQPHRQYSSELRFASDLLWDRLDFVAGVYYFNQNFEMTQRNFLTIVPNTPTVDVIRFFEQDHESYSIFAEGNYRITDKLTATVGARYTNDSKDFTPQLFGAFPAGGPLLETSSKSWDDFGPKVGLQYQWNDNVMTFASYTRGFKSGGFNGRCAQPFTCEQTFDPEEVDNFELGLKADFLDNRVRANIALFWSEHKNLQQSAIVPLPVGTPDPSETVTDNAASATIKGAELELTAVITEGLRFDLGVGYLDASYDEFCAAFGITASATIPTSTCGSVVPVGVDVNNTPTYLVDEDFSDIELRLAPEFTFSANVNYTFPVQNAGNVIMDARYSHTSKQFSDARELSPRKAVDLVDASVSFEDMAGKYRISVFGKNLTDTTYVTMRNLAAQLWTTRFTNPPRHFGVSFSYNF